MVPRRLITPQASRGRNRGDNSYDYRGDKSRTLSGRGNQRLATPVAWLSNLLSATTFNEARGVLIGEDFENENIHDW